MSAASLGGSVLGKDTLFVLKPDFQDQGRVYYCPGCAEVIGLLELYPALKERVTLHSVDFQRPRPVLVETLGEAHQSCPVLVLAEVPEDAGSVDELQEANGRAFVAGPEAIGAYLRHAHGIGIRY